METGVSPSTAELRTKIRSVVTESERIFLGFAKTYPSFVREMQRSLELSRKAVGAFSNASSLDEAMKSLFDSTRETLTDSAARFSAMHGRDELLLSSLSRGIDTLSGLDDIIARIKEDSIEMELISLNAMTVALKSGSAGKAFSVITEELKRLSTRTITLTEVLTGDGRNLLEQFRKYRIQVEELENSQKELFEGLDDRIREKFTALETSVREIASSLTEMVEGSRTVQAPVQSIMEIVQLQDLLRQSLDHVVMALDEIDEVSSEDAMDDLAFRCRLAELAESILHDVRLKLEAACAKLRFESDTINRVVADGEKKRRKLLDESFGRANTGSASRSFSDASEVILKIDSQVESYLKSKRSITQNGVKLSVSVESLEKQFKSFSKIIERFHTIDIASRIEVSKQSILKTMNDTVSEMSDLTNRIGKDVEQALTSTQGFIEDTKKSLAAYAHEDGGRTERGQVSRNQAVRGGKATDATLMDAHRRLEGLRDSIRDGAQSFSLFTGEFLALQDKSAADVGDLTLLITSVGDTAGVLESFRSAADVLLSAAPQRPDLEHLHSQRMKEVIERFTIYAHKQAAGELGGFTVEQGVDTGEITFF